MTLTITLYEPIRRKTRTARPTLKCRVKNRSEATEAINRLAARRPWASFALIEGDGIREICTLQGTTLTKLTKGE